MYPAKIVKIGYYNGLINAFVKLNLLNLSCFLLNQIKCL